LAQSGEFGGALYPPIYVSRDFGVQFDKLALINNKGKVIEWCRKVGGPVSQSSEISINKTIFIFPGIT